MDRDSPLYTSSWEAARKSDETTLWIKSHNANCDCARDIEEAIRKNFDGKHLESDCAKGIIGQYGFHRVMWVLANTLKEKAWDGRFSKENQEWAKAFFIPKDKCRNEFCVQSHPAVLDGFIDVTREAWETLDLFDSSHCRQGEDGMDYTNQVVVLCPFSLKDQYKTPEDQLFFATGGFGCSPTARGRKVFGTFLKDGESAQFHRSDFIGVIKEEFLPEWAAEKLQELLPPEESTSEDMQMGGM